MDFDVELWAQLYFEWTGLGDFWCEGMWDELAPEVRSELERRVRETFDKYVEVRSL